MLETKRCILKKPQKPHLSDIENLYINEDVRKYLGGVRDITSIRQDLQNMLNGSTDFYWVATDKTTHKFIGLVSLTPHHEQPNLEISYQFLPEWWGTGRATEVIKTIIHHAFNHLCIEKLIAETQTANIASCKLLEKVGMTREKTLMRFGAEQALFYIEAN